MRKPLTDKDGEVREITEEDMKHFKPAREVLPPEFFEAMENMRGKRGAQKAPTKTPVSLRLNPEVVDYFKEGGRGWQSRINKVLEDYISEDH